MGVTSEICIKFQIVYISQVGRPYNKKLFCMPFHLTVLLIARLIGDNPLIDFDLNSLITIRNSLKSVGLENLSKIITQEIITSKIINL